MGTLTVYMTSVQPSSVVQMKTVMSETKALSNAAIPKFRGPSLW